MTTQANTTINLNLVTISAFKHFAGMSEETNAFTANVLLMTAGFVLTGYQLAGYALEGAAS